MSISLLNIGEALGVLQHLDGISGTEKQEVAYDYAQRLSIGIDSAIVKHFQIEISNIHICDCRVLSMKHIRNFYLKLVKIFLINIFVS